MDRSLDRSNVWLCRLRRAWIVVRRCGLFRLAWCVGRSSQALREAVRVREKWKMFEVKIWAEIDFRWFLLILRSN